LEASAFDSLRRYVRHKISEIGSAVLSGEIDVHPYRFGSKTACEYCDLLGLCQFDLTYGDNQYRNLKKINGAQWLQALEEEGKSRG
jgi:ATP-dependent helicase/nuclease subunit B